MAKKKNISVQDVLELMKKDDTVIVRIYAYGIPAANTWADGMETVEDCLEKMNYDCLRARVGRIERNWARGYKKGVPDDKTDQWIEIHAEIVGIQ